MLKTPFGTIDILINGKSNNYKPIPLTCWKKNYSVNERYKIIVDIPFHHDQDVVVECILTEFTGDNAKGCKESGERLALISFYRYNTKLSIGVEDEITNVQCSYIDYGIKVILSEEARLNQIVFGIAWIAMKDKEREDIYTWFGADPTLMIGEGDWRLTNQIDYLYEKRLKHIHYVRYSESWDHDHCNFCWDTFSEFDGDLHEGYCTLDNYHWICEKCFHDFKDMFKWDIVEP